MWREVLGNLTKVVAKQREIGGGGRRRESEGAYGEERQDSSQSPVSGALWAPLLDFFHFSNY